jgi:hypothetical protein
MIAKVTQQPCSEVVTYLVVTTSIRSALFEGRTSEATYLKNIAKGKENLSL